MNFIFKLLFVSARALFSFFIYDKQNRSPSSSSSSLNSSIEGTCTRVLTGEFSFVIKGKLPLIGVFCFFFFICFCSSTPCSGEIILLSLLFMIFWVNSSYEGTLVSWGDFNTTASSWHQYKAFLWSLSQFSCPPLSCCIRPSIYFSWYQPYGLFLYEIGDSNTKIYSLKNLRFITSGMSWRGCALGSSGPKDSFLFILRGYNRLF